EPGDRQESPQQRARAERRLREGQDARAELLRRLAVCDRLEGLAAQLSDDVLGQRADELRGRAWEVYRQKTEKQAPPPEPADAAEKPAARKPAKDEDKPRGRPFRASHPWRVSS